MIRLLVNVYLATTIAALITFTMNYIKLNRFFRKRGVKTYFTLATFVLLVECFMPIRNIKFGIAYLNGALWTEEEYEEFYQDYL